MVNWAELGDDLLADVALKLDAIEDFVYFSVVCHSWNRASSFVKRDWKPSMPYLLLAEYQKENPKFIREILRINNDRCYQFSLTQTFGTSRCYGSSNGWLVIIALDGQTHLLNPLSKERLRLPPHSTMPNRDDKDSNPILRARRKPSINKAIVVKDVERGNDGTDLIVFVTHSVWRLLAFARTGDQTWTRIVPPRPSDGTPYEFQSHRAVDLVLRDKMLLILYMDASIGYIDLSDLKQPVEAKEFLPAPKDFELCFNMYFPEMYLVESFGSLLMVRRVKDRKPYSQVGEGKGHKTGYFVVFRFDSEVKRWEKVKELGDVALFIGGGHSIAVRASDCRNCKSDCIYFTDVNSGYRHEPKKLGELDMGIFDLKIGKIHKFDKGDNGNSDVSKPFWFMPRF